MSLEFAPFFSLGSGPQWMRRHIRPKIIMSRGKHLALHLTAILLLGVALLPMPYGYYTFLRISLCLLFGGVFSAHVERGAVVWPLICGAVIVTYNPIISIHLARDEWTIINLATIVVAVVSAVIMGRADRRKEKPG